MLCMVLNPAFADDTDESNDNDEITSLKREALVKEVNIDEKATLEKRKSSKKKKGARNVKVQPSQEDDKNIILELDGN